MPKRGKDTNDREDTQIGNWIERIDQFKPALPVPPPAAIRCVFHTAVVIEAGRTPSGRRYEFKPGEVRGDVDPADVDYLLSLEREQHPCCSGGAVRPLKFFELA